VTGTRGLSQIKDAGGLVLVQDEATAQFDGMPRSARDTGIADLVLSPESLAARLQLYLRSGSLDEDALVSSQAAARESEELAGEAGADGAQDRGAGAPAASSGPAEAVLALIERRFGADFRQLQPTLVQRRLKRRLDLSGSGSIEAYRKLLDETPEELEALFRDLVVGISRFFDGQESWQALENCLVTRLRDHDSEKDFRVWVPGCSTGEEAYSLAIVLEQAFAALDKPPRYKVFATDIDDRAIEFASRANFGGQIEEDVGRDRLLRFFLRLTSGYSIVRRVRERVIFARHDLAKDPPFTRMNLISCRNVLGSFQEEPRRRILGSLQFALRESGLLFLGSAEGVGRTERAWKLIDGKHRIFERLAVAESDELWRQYGYGTDPERNLERDRADDRFRSSRREQQLISKICGLLAEQFGASVLVFDSGERLSHAFGDTREIVQLPQGEIRTESRSVLDSSVHLPITTALRRVRDGESSSVEMVLRPGPDSVAQLLQAHRLGSVDSANLRFVVVIRKVSQVAETRGAVTDGDGARVAPTELAADLKVDELLAERVKELEDLLEDSQDRLQDTVHELEATNEELQSTNEELIAANEELQSTNEELHSVNEELYTVNAEHRRKILDLTEVNREIQAIFQCSQVGAVLLDRELRVRRYSAAIQAVLPLVEHDVGRPISDLAHYLEDFDLGDFAREAQEGGDDEHRRVRGQDGREYLLQGIDLGRNEEHAGVFHGLILSFVDITDLSRTESRLAESEAQHRLVTEGISDVVFWVEEHEMRLCRYVSPAFEAVWGVPFSANNETGWLSPERIHVEDRERVLGEFFRSARLGRYDCEYRIVRPDGEVRWIHDRAYRIDESSDDVTLIAGFAQDVTDEVQARQAYRKGLALYRDVFDHAGGGLLLCRDDGVIVRANLACANILGQGPGQLPRLRIEDLFDPRERRSLMRLFEEFRGGEHKDPVSMQLRGRDGDRGLIEASFSQIRVDDEATHHVVAHLGDLSEAISTVEELRTRTKSLESEANEDPLTGLMNRRGLEKSLQGNKLHAERSGESMVVMLIDLDDFKGINDTCGHPVGDQVLKEVSRRFRRLYRPTDLVSRIGGDEFLAILPDTRLGEGMHVAERLRRELISEPVAYIEGRPIFVTASIGAARVPDPVASLDGVIALATRALKLSKKSGKNRVRAEGVSRDFENQKEEIERALGDVLEGRGLFAVRQSIRVLEDGGLLGYEFFARCSTPALADPQDFFRICMDRNILGSTDLQCLRLGVQAARECEPEVQLHFNLFPTTLLETPTDELLEVLHPVGDLSRICLELSEQHFIGDPARLKLACDALQKHGVRIGVDDIGFGRSSLETLVVLEPDCVKVDRTMSQGIAESGKKQRMMSRLVNVCVSLELQMIVEGVETSADRRLLRELGVDYAQGFLWDRPERIGPPAS
jgi:two-component system CheB/CheR fusion protein